jgi:septal ring factor EnvC (AmiA/AmiB activator)
MHTDPTLDILSSVTTSLGNSLRTFEQKTCAAFETRELERERAARQRRQKSATNEASESRRPTAPNSNARKPKKLNLRTYKLHALGDYVDTIRRFGTTDSYSTQSVSI